MPTDTFDKEKCRQRNRLAARAGVEAAPLTFLREAPPPSDLAKVLWARGTMPQTDEEALARINAKLPDGAEPLTLEQVYVHEAEVANGSFIPDRFAFLDSATLKNIAADAAEGFAFLNSHRSGGLSHPAELPFGKTFAGRFERRVGDAGEVEEKTLVGLYMLRGQHPNGMSGPSTDDLHRGIAGGTIFDVSVGLYGGSMQCDVCGADMEDYSACEHVPGTTMGMGDEDMAAQEDRGIPGGMASYTIRGAHCAEVSAVFDGAVPGAGFRRAMAFAKDHKLSRQDLAAVRKAYAPLLKSGDLPDNPPVPERTKAMGLKVSAMKLFGLWSDQGQAEEVDLSSLVTTPESTPMSPAIPPPADPTEVAALRTELATSKAELERVAAEFKTSQDEVKAKAAAELEASFKRDAETFANAAMKERNLFLPASRTLLLPLLERLARDDQEHPTGGISRVGNLHAFVESLTPHNLLGRPLTNDDLPEGSELTRNASGNGVEKPTASRIEELMKKTETGRAELERRSGSK